MHNKVSRRQFLRAAAVAAGAAALAAVRRASGWRTESAAPTPTPSTRAYLPLAFRREPPRVVRVHAATATSWDYQTGWYGEYVDQGVVDDMLERGLLELTRTSSLSDAWAVLLPDYQPGLKIAVKVNLNNATCDSSSNAIDALIEPVNALIRSLVLVGVREDDVWVYDAQRPMPGRFYSRRLYSSARFFDRDGCADEAVSWAIEDESQVISFSFPAMVTRRWLTSLLFRTTYLINMPLLKRHSAVPVTLGFKNHFGSTNNLVGEGNDNPHVYLDPAGPLYRADANPVVDIYANPNIAGKTVLTVGDGLLGADWVAAVPRPWATFGQRSPNSLFFSRDPVAADCVMCDILRAEFGLDEAAYDPLRTAERLGLGLFERGEPWGAGYSRIQYVQVEI